jgi:hypothetical protein
MLYFAYASNMSPRQMAERCPGHVVVGVGTLADYRIEFRGRSESWGGAVADLAVSHGSAARGVVYDLTDEQIRILDGYEGYHGAGDQHNVYDRNSVTVELVRPLDGSVPRRVRAQCYFARHGVPGVPSRRYLETILEGARHYGLPEDYVDRLARTPAMAEEG